MRNSIVKALGGILLATCFASAPAFAAAKTYSTTCDAHLDTKARSEIKQFNSDYENTYKGQLAVQARMGQSVTQSGVDGKGGSAAGVAGTNASAASAQNSCSEHVARLRKEVNNACSTTQGPTKAYVNLYNDYQDSLKEFDGKCVANSGQAALQAGANAQNQSAASALEGKSDKGVLAKTGGFLKDNAMPLIIGAGAGLAAYALMDDDDDKKSSKPAATTTTTEGTATTTTTTAGTDGSTKLDKPSDTTTQTEQLTTKPTEVSDPVTAVGTATENDPAYTGIGSAQGDTGGLRDEGAGEFLTSFACGTGETDAACRLRYGCTADEAMSVCQARWDSGLVSVK